VCFDPETIEMLRKVLDEAWDALSPSGKQTTLKTELAERILAAAGLGDRDPKRLRSIALMRPVQTAALPNRTVFPLMSAGAADDLNIELRVELATYQSSRFEAHAPTAGLTGGGRRIT
jgi:hypothetical protein